MTWTPPGDQSHPIPLPDTADRWAMIAHRIADRSEKSANDVCDMVASILATTRKRRRRAADLERAWATAQPLIAAAVDVRGLAHQLALGVMPALAACQCPRCDSVHPYTPE